MFSPIFPDPQKLSLILWGFRNFCVMNILFLKI